MPAPKTRMPIDSNAVPLSGGRPVAAMRVHHGRKHPTMATTAPIATSRRDLRTGFRCMGLRRSPRSPLAVDLGLEPAHVAQVAIQLAVIQPVADDELVRDREPDVIDIDLDEAARR